MSEPQAEKERTASRPAAVRLEKGSVVEYEGGVWMIERVADFKSVVATHLEERITQLLPIQNLNPAPVGHEGAGQPRRPLDYVPHEDWGIAEQRYDAIEPLLKDPRRSREDVEARAAAVGANAATLYRWIQRYSAVNCLTALIPRTRGWTKGKTRIPVHAEEVITDVIDDFYLTTKRRSIEKTVIEVETRCRDRSIKVPAPSTVRARIGQIPEHERLRRRGFREKARALLPKPGHFPNADYPLAYVQIDHTKVDIILVDDVHRRPIGRPWVTVAIDVFSRMITGYYLALDAPSETSVALCIAHSVQPKDAMLMKRGIEAEWPVWGFPGTIHADNGGEFRSNNFKQSCRDKGITVELRPVKRPEYGGHIERLVGTLMTEVHELPGTTHSSVADKGEHDAEKSSALTFSEFENWLIKNICKIYQQREHSVLGMPPISKWKLAIIGTEDTPGTGMPQKPDGDVLLDFLPRFERTVQRTGVNIDNLQYYADALQPWIGARDPDEQRRPRKLSFRRDPRDISKVWFCHPDLEQYIEIPTADRKFPPTNVWEYREARQRLKEQGRTYANPERVLEAIREVREDAEAAVRKTKARRSVQRRKEHARKRGAETAPPPPGARPATDHAEPVPELYDERPPSFGVPR